MRMGHVVRESARHRSCRGPVWLLSRQGIYGHARHRNDIIDSIWTYNKSISPNIFFQKKLARLLSEKLAGLLSRKIG